MQLPAENLCLDELIVTSYSPYLYLHSLFSTKSASHVFFSFKELPSYSPGCSNQALGVLLSFFLNQVLRGHTSPYLLNQFTSSLATNMVHTTITYVSYLKYCNSFLTVLSASRLFFFQSVCTFQQSKHFIKQQQCCALFINYIVDFVLTFYPYWKIVKIQWQSNISYVYDS